MIFIRASLSRPSRAWFGSFLLSLIAIESEIAFMFFATISDFFLLHASPSRTLRQLGAPTRGLVVREFLSFITTFVMIEKVAIFFFSFSAAVFGSAISSTLIHLGLMLTIRYESQTGIQWQHSRFQWYRKLSSRWKEKE